MITNIFDRLLRRRPKLPYPDAEWLDTFIESRLGLDGLIHQNMVCLIRNALIEGIIKTFNIVIDGDASFVDLRTVKDDLRKSNNALYSYSHEALDFIVIATDYSYTKYAATAVILNELLLYKSLWQSYIPRDRVSDFCKMMSELFNDEFTKRMRTLIDYMLVEMMRLAGSPNGRVHISLPDIPKLAKPEFPPGRFVKY